MAAKKSKSCADCHKKKDIDKFVPSPKAKDGRSKYCRICWGKRMSKAKQKAKRVREKAASNGESVPLSATTKAVDRSVALANAALMRANGTPGSKRSPIRKLMQELHKHLSAQGAEIESISFEGDQCRVTYRKTETFSL